MTIDEVAKQMEAFISEFKEIAAKHSGDESESERAASFAQWMVQSAEEIYLKAHLCLPSDSDDKDGYLTVQAMMVALVRDLTEKHPAPLLDTCYGYQPGLDEAVRELKAWNVLEVTPVVTSLLSKRGTTSEFRLVDGLNSVARFWRRQSKAKPSEEKRNDPK